MFTGIIEETGVAREVGSRLTVGCRTVLSDITPGASVAVNGVCLTAVDITADSFSADLAPETLRRSNLGDLVIGSKVNLERPVSLAQRLSGHIVQGHVDGTGEFLSMEQLGRPLTGGYASMFLAELDRHFWYFKGSIAIDGISLTIAAIEDCVLSATVIPHTYHHTTLGTRKSGDRINLECDVLAKHVEKLMSFNSSAQR